MSDSGDRSKRIPFIHRLDLMAPYPLETALAYSGTSYWLGLYWEKELNQFCYSDGQSIGNNLAWQLFRTHPQVSHLLAPYQFGDNGQPAHHYILLNRETRNLYVGEGAIVEAYLQQPQILALLAALDANSAVPAVSKNDGFCLESKVYRHLPIIVGILLLLLGLPVFEVGIILMTEKADWLELPECLDLN